MRKRSISSKHFFGGFFGGILGILAFALIHPHTLPVGCLVGIIVGFWYQEIIVALVKSCKRTAVIWKERSIRTVSLFSRKSISENVISPIVHFLGANKVCRFFNVKRSSFLNWICGHPMNRASFLSMIAVTIFAVIHLVSGVFFISLFLERAMYITLVSITFLEIVILLCMDVFIRKSKDYYKRYEMYSRKGSLYFFTYTFLELFRKEAVALTYITYLFVIYTPLQALFYPATFCILFIREMHRIVSSKSHWLCFSVTLAATVLSARLTGGYLSNDVMILWIVALATGCVSGGISELLRRMIAKVFARIKFMHILWDFSILNFFCKLTGKIMTPVNLMVNLDQEEEPSYPKWIPCASRCLTDGKSYHWNVSTGEVRWMESNDLYYS